MTTDYNLKLTLHLIYPGTYSSAWRTDETDASDLVSPEFFVNAARIAERGTFDAVFLADNLMVPDGFEHRVFYALEPTITLATIAAHTSHIGLIGTISTSYNEPFNLARRIASLDHVSGGRAGWNIVTTADSLTHLNFGLERPSSREERYARALEFADTVVDLWDSWEDGALVGDKDAGRLIDPDRVHKINHAGDHYRVRGPLNVPRPPQGHPIRVQAGGSEGGLALAVRHADMVFALLHTIDEAKAYRQELDRRLIAQGRQAGEVVVMPGLVTIIGSTEEEARRREEQLWDLVPIRHGLNRLAFILGVDPDSLDLDAPLPENITPPRDRSKIFFEKTVTRAREGRLTVRELIKAQGGGTSHRIIVGTPEKIADDIERWYRADAVGGFNIMADVLPSGIEAFVDGVVPLLRARKLFRQSYTGKTLRDHLGLARPSSRFSTPDARRPGQSTPSQPF